MIGSVIDFQFGGGGGDGSRVVHTDETKLFFY